MFNEVFRCALSLIVAHEAQKSISTETDYTIEYTVAENVDFAR